MTVVRIRKQEAEEREEIREEVDARLFFPVEFTSVCDSLVLERHTRAGHLYRLGEDKELLLDLSQPSPE